jgi:AraC-like DNA-binding protein
MSDTSQIGVLYTEHSGLRALTPIGSLWSYETQARERDRRRIAANPDGSREYWLDRSDPLLNTILPGTGVSLIVNLADSWAAGRSLASSALVPRVCVMGPFTKSRILRIGKSVRAVGAVLPTTMTRDVFGVPASELVDRIVPLADLWPRDDVERLFTYVVSGFSRTGGCASGFPPPLAQDRASFGETRRSLGEGGSRTGGCASGFSGCVSGCLLCARPEGRAYVSALKDELVSRLSRRSSPEPIGQASSRLMKLHGGRVSIDELARSHGLSRQRFSARFSAAAGLRPKLFARITRFQTLVRVLLSTDVSEWASMSPAVGFYDQAHMINEFRVFAGSPPTVFFQPHGGGIDPAKVQLRGRPSEWVRRPDPSAADTHLVDA